jgi:hypothetical protein
MDQRFRRGFTAAEKTELWERWQRGESLKAIGRAFGKPSSSIYYQVAPHEGDSSGFPASLAFSIDGLGARGDIERHCGASPPRTTTSISVVGHRGWRLDII